MYLQGGETIRFEVKGRGRGRPKEIKLDQFDPTEMEAGGSVLTAEEEDARQDHEEGRKADDLAKEVESNFCRENKVVKAAERDESGDLLKVEEGFLMVNFEESMAKESKVKVKKGVMAKKAMKKTVKKQLRSHSCPESGCDEKFNRTDLLSVHLHKAHGKEGLAFKCLEPGCAASYAVVSSLKQHMFTVHKKSLKKKLLKACSPDISATPQPSQPHTTCSYPECGSSFDNLENLCDHMKKVHRRFLCPELDCGATFTRVDNMKSHIGAAHRNERLTCPEENCDRTFSGIGNRRKHILKMHGKDKDRRYLCTVPSCERKFKWKESLHNHLKTSHGLTGPEEDCSSSFARDYDLHQHLHAANDIALAAPIASQPSCTPETAPVSQPETAPVSLRAVALHPSRDVLETTALPLANSPTQLPTISDSQASASSAGASVPPEPKALKREVFATHLPSPKSFPCPEEGCDAAFANALQLGNHVRTIHGHFSCSVKGCKFTSISASRLKQHKVHVHSGRRFECPESDCFLTFSQAYNLYLHIKSTHRQYKFKCPDPTCGKTFKQPATLKNHVSSAHQQAYPSFTVFQVLSNSPKPVKLAGTINENCPSEIAPKFPQLHACPEESCGAEFTRKDQLYRHLRVEHTQKERLTSPSSPTLQAAGPSLTLSSAETSTPALTEATAANENPGQLPELVGPSAPSAGLTCPMAGCGVTFSHVAQLGKHVRAVHGQVSCPELGCSFVSGTYSKLKQHIAIVHENRRFVCPEEDCNAKYTLKKSLSAHIRVEHRQQQKLVCPHQDCGAAFKWRYNMKQHVKAKHSSAAAPLAVTSSSTPFSADQQLDRRFVCPEEDCNAKYTLKTSLFAHIRVEHRQKQKLACPHQDCGASFKWKQSLKNHVKAQHTPKTAPSMAVTSSNTSTPFSADQQHDQRFVCPEEGCIAKYFQRHSLSAHIWVEHRQQQKLVCPHPDCGATFKWKQSLKHHVKAQHSSEDEQLYACSVGGCQARFSKRINLTKHIRVKHSQQSSGGMRRFACPYQDCGWSFELRQSLEKHVKSKHGLEELHDSTQDQTISSSTSSQGKTAIGSDAETHEVQTDSHPAKPQACLEEERDKQSTKEESPRGPYLCSAPGCGFVIKFSKNIVQHWNNKHSDDPSKATFTDQATGATLDIYATCKFIVQCKVCMKVRTARDKMAHLVSNMRDHIAAAHPVELEATNGCAAPLYRVLQDYTGKKDH